MRINISLIALTITLAGTHCATTPRTAAPAEVGRRVTQGAPANATHLRYLWFSGQPDQQTLEAAKEIGVRVVINLRDPSEQDWDERKAAEDLGLIYYNVPMPAKEPFSPEAIDHVEALVEAHPGEQTLIHCSSGNRAAGWLAVHLVDQHQMTVEDALVVGRDAGITKAAIETKVRTSVAEPLSPQ
jgi:protein tyrosine phosphatase (PTP) superfamily phosphohydrolase (DUF442 family)